MIALARRQSRLLGAAVLYEFRKASAFRVGFVIRELLVGIERPIVMILVYKAIYRGSSSETIRGFDFPDIVAYLILAATLWKLVVPERLLDLSEQIFEGYITKFLVMPVRFFTLVLGRYVQYTSLQVFVALSFWAVGLALVSKWWPVPVDGLAVAQALVLVGLGSYCYFLLLVVLNTLAFWLDVVWTLLVMSRFVVGFVSGQLIPVSMMPDGLQAVFHWLFPYWMISAPIEILMGRLGTTEFLQGLAVLAVTVVLLQGLVALTWRRGLRRYTGAGM